MVQRMRDTDGRVIQATPYLAETQDDLVEAGVVSEATEPPRKVVQMLLDTQLSEAQERVQRQIAEGISKLQRDIVEMYAENLEDSYIIGKIGDVFFERLVDIIESIESQKDLPENTRITGNMFMRAHVVGNIQKVLSDSGNTIFGKTILGLQHMSLSENPDTWQDPRFGRKFSQEIEDTEVEKPTEIATTYYVFLDPNTEEEMLRMQIEYGKLPFNSTFNEQMHEYLKGQIAQAFDVFLNIIYQTIQLEAEKKKK